MKSFYLLLLLISLSVISYSQTSLGVKLGANLSTVAFKPSVTLNPILLYNAGVIFKHFEKDEHAGVQLEINFSQKGWTETIDSVNSYNRRINYIELPFMSHFFAGTDKSNVFLNLGPYIGYSLSAKEKVVTNDIEETTNYKFTDSDNRFDLGVLAGIGVKKQFSFGILQLEGRFSYGVGNVVKAIGARDFTASKNQVISASLAYLVDFRSLKVKRKIPADKALPLNE